jgi:hypothetical protein
MKAPRRVPGPAVSQTETEQVRALGPAVGRVWYSHRPSHTMSAHSWHLDAVRLYRDCPDLTPREIADQFNVSRERVRQVVQEALGDTSGYKRRRERTTRRLCGTPPRHGTPGRLVWDIASDLGFTVQRVPGTRSNSLMRINGFLCRIRVGTNMHYEQSLGGCTHFHLDTRDAEFQILVQDTERTERILIVPNGLLRPDVWVPIEGYRRIEHQPPTVGWLAYVDAWHCSRSRISTSVESNRRFRRDQLR